MVSIRRRKRTGPCTGRSSSSVPPPCIPEGNVPTNPGQSGKRINMQYIPSVALNQPLEVKEEKEIKAGPHAKKQKIRVQIDPENPMDVHAYLMQLKEDHKLELGPMQRSEEMPVKEWMEKCYPYIFRVFPQDPKVLSQFSEKSKQIELLYCHYWLFLLEVRNIVFMDHHVSPEYVESLGKVMKTLEKQGFDCRFMRSELVVVRYIMKNKQEILLAEKNMIAARAENLQKQLLAAATKEEKEVEFDKRGKQIEEMTTEVETFPKQLNKLHKDQCKGQGKLNKLLGPALEQEYIEVILERHKKMLASKEEEGKRLNQVLEKINQLH